MTPDTATTFWIEGRIKQDEIDRYLDRGRDFIDDDAIWQKINAAAEPSPEHNTIWITRTRGAGDPEHIVNVIQRGHADAVSCAHMFHYKKYSIREVKEALQGEGVSVRI